MKRLITIEVEGEEPFTDQEVAEALLGKVVPAYFDGEFDGYCEVVRTASKDRSVIYRRKVTYLWTTYTTGRP